MKELTELIKERIVNLQQIIKEKETSLQNTPEGIINITQSPHNGVQYYYKKDSSDSQKKYMKKRELPLIKKICQKDYDQKVLKSAQNELLQLERLNRNYPKQTYEEIYEKMNMNRQELITPVVLPDTEFIKEWERFEYAQKPFSENSPEYYTEKGERVRSKSEILIANALNKHNIPYRYECPLHLKGYGWIHPDFTVLNVRLRKVFYWEHLGKMDDSEYIENTLQRISMYEKNNIFPGKTLILTHETLKHPINTKDIESVITRYLL